MVSVNVAELVSGTRRLLVWSFYGVGGANVANVWDVKWRQFRAFLMGNSCPSAFVAVASEVTGDTIASAKTLERYLSSMENLPDYLCGAHEST